MISNVDLMFSNEQSSLSTKNITFLSKKKKNQKTVTALKKKNVLVTYNIRGT